MPESSPKASKVSLSLDYRVIIGLLVVVTLVMLFLWKPWQGDKVSDRTIEVTGQATVSARPDEFTFYPTYDFKNNDKEAALKQLGAKGSKIVADLKKLGVADKNIKVNSDSWSYPVYELRGGSQTSTYTLRLTIVTNTDDLTKKVQDYLATTSPSGTISPQASFSETKLKAVEAQGRDEATKEARQKAEQSAQNLGFRLVSVKTVNDGAGFGIYPYYSGKEVAVDNGSGRSTPSIPIQPGENELTYTVTVTYYIK